MNLYQFRYEWGLSPRGKGGTHSRGVGKTAIFTRQNGRGGSILGQIYVTSFMSSPLPLQLAISLSSLSRWVTTSARTRFRWIGPPVRIWLIFDKNSSPRSKSRRTWQDGSKSRTSLSDFAGKSYRCNFFRAFLILLANPEDAILFSVKIGRLVHIT